MKPEPKYKIGQIVVMKLLKRELPFRILGIKYYENDWYYQWNKNDYVSEYMIRELNTLERGEVNDG